MPSSKRPKRREPSFLNSGSGASGVNIAGEDRAAREEREKRERRERRERVDSGYAADYLFYWRRAPSFTCAGGGFRARGRRSAEVASTCEYLSLVQPLRSKEKAKKRKPVLLTGAWLLASD